MTYGDNQLLGVDPKVITNPITGHPQAVIVDNQQFTIISKIIASPHSFWSVELKSTSSRIIRSIPCLERFHGLMLLLFHKIFRD